MKKIFYLITLTVIGVASAQAPSAEEIIAKVEEQQKNAKDLSFRAVGKISAQDVQQKLDFIVKSLPAKNLVRVQFMAPDSLADNVLVVDKKEIRQYLFLTNQITVTSLDKASSDFGLSSLDFSQMGNTSKLLKGYNTKVTASKKSGSATLYQITASAKSSGSSNSSEKIKVWVSSKGWQPTQITVVDSKNKPLISLQIRNYKMNSGLTAAKLRLLPKNAQVIRQ